MKLNLKNMKIRTKISLVVSIILAIALATIATVTLMNVYTSSKSQAQTLAKNISVKNASDITSNLEKVRVTLLNVENSIMYARKNGTMSREQIIELLSTTLSKTPNVFAVYTLWEPNMFDGKDSKYVSKPGHDATGRFIPYVVRSEGKITLEPLVDYEKEGAGDYYLQPKKTGKVTLIEPLIYKVAGEDVLMISLTVPIYDENKTFVGMLGADLDLSSLQKTIENIKPLGGYSTLLTTKGVYVANAVDSKKIMTNATDEGGQWNSIIEYTSKGKELLIDDVASTTGEKILRVFEPIHLDETDAYWTFGSNIPMISIFAEFNSILKTVIILSLISFFIMLGVIILFTRRITKPLIDAVIIADKVAMGDLSGEILVQSGDEIGKLMVSLNNMVTSTRLQAEAAEKIAEGNLSVVIKPRCENDVLSKSMKLVAETLKNLSEDLNILSVAAIEGKLDTRADASKYSGDYRKILEGINNTLDAVIEPIKETAEVLTEISNGNLSVYVKGDYKGDHADIKNVLNLTIQSLNEVFTEINNAADQVSSGSIQVSDGSQALSQGTTQQASAIEELTASITEVAAQTKQNAVNSSQANELALNVKEGAALGNSHMKEMLKSMEEINESSSNISKIIKVIDDIAFQTNMLALNAAVEAARAGQHGKGFAVVAEEVRNLAARSAKAAKETTDLVEGSIKKVEIGTKIANNTAESLDQIVIGVSKAATLVGEIAAASNEQATAIYQINKGIEQVSDVVQTNSATAEQSAAASEELSSQASMLKNMVGKFRLKRGAIASYNEVSLGSHRNPKQVKNRFLAHAEAAATKNKPKISLSNTDFGKY